MSDTIDNERFRRLLLSFPGKAIAFLYDQYYRSLLNIARNLTHDHRVSEDIVQETFVHVWENHKKLGQHQDTPIEFYLVRVVRNKAISHYKKVLQINGYKNQYLHSHVFTVNDHPIESRIIQEEINREVRQIIETFPRREKECLLMKMDGEMTADQIAESLKVSRKAVERSLTSAIKRLRKYWLARR